jgi:hypothetical protein
MRVLAAPLFFAVVAHADSVLIRGGGVLLPNNVNTFYGGEAGITSSVVNSISAADLVGQDLLIVWEPSGALSGAELGAIATFLAGGNTVAFFGENSGFPPTNAAISSAIATLGGSMSIVPGTSYDNGFQTITAAAGQILPHALTAGVDVIDYGSVSGVAGVAGGNALFLSQDKTTTWGAYELAGGGAIVLIADSNLEMLLLNDPSNDNDRFFRNLLSADLSGGVPVPEPGTPVLLGAVLLGYGLSRRRKATELDVPPPSPGGGGSADRVDEVLRRRVRVESRPRLAQAEGQLGDPIVVVAHGDQDPFDADVLQRLEDAPHRDPVREPVDVDAVGPVGRPRLDQEGDAREEVQPIGLLDRRVDGVARVRGQGAIVDAPRGFPGRRGQEHRQEHGQRPAHDEKEPAGEEEGRRGLSEHAREPHGVPPLEPMGAARGDEVAASSAARRASRAGGPGSARRPAPRGRRRG